MIFGFRDPLKKSLSAEDLLRSQKSATTEGAFIGALPLDRAPVVLPLKAGSRVCITGELGTMAANVMLPFLRRALETRQSIFLLDFQAAEEYWHRLWAMSFNLDRGRDFRLLDVSDPERSDVLSPSASAHLATQTKVEHLRSGDQSFDPVALWRDHQGIVSTWSTAEQLDTLWAVCEPFIGKSDLTVVYGWDHLTPARQEAILQATAKSALVVSQEAFREGQKRVEFQHITFRTESPLPAWLLERWKTGAKDSGLEKIFPRLTPNLDILDQVQGLAEVENRTVLFQTARGDGLPWPPDYRPLRARYPGN